MGGLRQTMVWLALALALALAGGTACDALLGGGADGSGAGGADGGGGAAVGESRDPGAVGDGVLAFSGLVYDVRTLAPVAGALVSTDPPIGQIRTNGQGMYVFAAPDFPGLSAQQRYALRAERPGYLPSDTEVLVGDGHLRHVDIPLTEAAAEFRIVATPEWIDVTPADFYGDEAVATRQVRVQLAGPEAADVPFSVNVPTGDARWLRAAPTEGTVGATPVFFDVHVDRGAVAGDAAGGYRVFRSEVNVVAEGGVAAVLVTLRLGTPPCDPCPAGQYCDGAACVVAVCAPTCAGRSCGVDGCGNSCGTCPAGLVCADGVCEDEPCAPDCDGRLCGDDGCGGTCGACTGDTTCRDGRCEPGSVVPVTFTGGTVVRVFDAPTAAARGLAFGDGALWVGEVGATLHRVDPHGGGALAGGLEGPAAAPVDLAWAPGPRLYAAYAGDRVFRIDLTGGRATELAGPFGDCRGIAYDGARLVTWQGDSLVLRWLDDGAIDDIRGIDDGVRLLTHTQGRFLVFRETNTTDQFGFDATILALDGTRPTSAPLESELAIPVDSSLVLGLASHGDTLWLLGGGAGANANRIVEVELE